MAGANPAPIIAVKIFVEENEIAPVRVALKKFRAACYGTAAVRIAKENVNEPPGNFRRYLPEIGFGAGMRGALDFKIRSEEHTSELQSHLNLVCRLLLEKKKNKRAAPNREREC